MAWAGERCRGGKKRKRMRWASPSAIWERELGEVERDCSWRKWAVRLLNCLLLHLVPFCVKMSIMIEMSASHAKCIHAHILSLKIFLHFFPPPVPSCHRIPVQTVGLFRCPLSASFSFSWFFYSTYSPSFKVQACSEPEADLRRSP